MFPLAVIHIRLSFNPSKINGSILTKRQAWLYSLPSISNNQNQESAKVKIQEIIFQAQFGNTMAPFAPNHLTQTLQITYPTEIQQLAKRLTCSVYFIFANRSVKTLLFIAGYNSKQQMKLLNRIFQRYLKQINEITFKQVSFSLV